MLVADIMTRRPVMVRPEATVDDALTVMTARGISSAMVLPLPFSAEYGIVTMRDIVAKVVTPDLASDAVRVGDIVTWRPVTVAPSTTVPEASQVMARLRVRRLPVTAGGDLVGIISDTDIFTALIPHPEWESVRQVRKERARFRAAQGGAVGTIADLMSAPVLTIRPTDTVAAAVRKMVAAGISSLLVYGEEGELGGIITKRDVVTKVVASVREPGDVRVREIMSSPVRTLPPDTTLQECSDRMVAEGMRRFPIRREDRVIGIVSDTDILGAVAAHRWLGRRRPTAAIVADVMRPPAPARHEHGVTPELSLWAAAARMVQAGVRELSVVQDGQIIGIVADVDIVRALEERGGAD